MKVLKIPFGGGSLNHNIECKEGPDEIVRVFNDIWMNEDMIATPNLSDLEIEEVEVKEEKSIVEAHKKIYEHVKKFGFGIYLGGDHSITYPCFKAFSENFKNPGIIVFDAHPDTFSEHDHVTHQDWLKFLVDEGIVKGENVIVIAVRNADVKEIEYMKKNNIRFCLAKGLYKNVENVCDTIMEAARKFDALYLSLDIDAIDPAFAPGTGYIEPAGLTSREMLYFIQRIKLLKNLKAVDIVEVNPSKDVNGMTVKLSAKMIGELL